MSNRRTFDEMLDSYFEQAVMMKRPCPCCFIDVDFFKKYNDHYGHQKGDEVISAIAKSIKDSIRHMDFVARYGGERICGVIARNRCMGLCSNFPIFLKPWSVWHLQSSQSLVASHVTTV